MTGKYKYSIDDKGRLFVPSKLREELGRTFYVAMGLDGCLSIYTQEGWDAITEKVKAMPRSQARKMRILFANCAKCEPDKQFRFLIPTELREYAHLKTDVMFIGVGDYAEIWDYDAYMAEEQAQMTPEALGALMDELGL